MSLAYYPLHILTKTINLLACVPHMLSSPACASVLHVFLFLHVCLPYTCYIFCMHIRLPRRSFPSKLGLSPIVAKMDLSKDYDSVCWIYLRMLLIHIGFSLDVVNWIMACVSSIFFSILMNGAYITFLHPESGGFTKVSHSLLTSSFW
jgi:hypothetical protein